MSRHNRHPKRQWFGATAGTYANTVGTYAQLRDRPSMPPAMDSPVVKAVLSPLQQVEREAASLLEDRSLAIWERRDKYPAGWVKAPYVAVPGRLLAALRGEQ